MDWTIAEDRFDPERIAHLGNQYLTGNGYMGVRGALEEYGKEQLGAVNLSGVYDRAGEGWREPLNAPNGLYTYVSEGGTAYRLPGTAPLSHTQALDYRHGIHRRHTRWRTGGGVLTVSSERFASMDMPHLICLRYTVETDFDGEITLVTGIDADVWDIHGPHYTDIKLDSHADTLTALATAHEGGRAAVCASLRVDFEPEPDTIESGKAILRRMRIHTRPGAAYTLYKYIAVYTSRDVADPLRAASLCAEEAANTEYGTWKDDHVLRWETLWERSEVVIEGDDTAMEALNYSIYHLHCIAPRPFASRSIAARGLSGQTYKGAVFWDTEMFMLDFYLNTEPEVARTLLRYRIDTLPGALNKAREYGYEGGLLPLGEPGGGIRGLQPVQCHRCIYRQGHAHLFPGEAGAYLLRRGLRTHAVRRPDRGYRYPRGGRRRGDPRVRPVLSVPIAPAI